MRAIFKRYCWQCDEFVWVRTGLIVMAVLLCWEVSPAATIKGMVKGLEETPAELVGRQVSLLMTAASLGKALQMVQIDESGQFIFRDVTVGTAFLIAVEAVVDPGVTKKKVSETSVRISRESEVELIINDPKEIISVTLTLAPPKEKMIPESVESVTFEVMEKYFPVILEDMAILIEYDKQRNPIEKSTKGDLEKDRMRAALWQVKRERQEELLRKYGITPEDLQRWRPAVWDSPLKEKYFNLHPEMRKKYEQITRPVKPVPLENQDGK